jgi:glycosyltransferase involved in cell wall biosynthesis
VPTGVSVVIPSCRGAVAASATIASLDAQTLAPDRFEVVLVVNGPPAHDLRPFESMRRGFPRLRVRLLATSAASASLAWNLGVQTARMEWLTFLDDDDTVTPAFLSALLAEALPGVVPLAPIHDVHDDGTVDVSSALNSRIVARSGTTVAAGDLPQALGFNASKLIPTRWAKAVAYDLGMTNGQDIAYFAELSLHHDITFAVVAADAGAAYRRGISDTSMSRQGASFEFSIEQRLHVIERIDRTRRRTRRSRRDPADHLIGAQVHLMNRYLAGHPERWREAVDAVARLRLGWFPYRDLNRDLAERLVVVPDGIAASSRRRRELARCVARSTAPVDVLAVAEQRPARSWVRDFWLTSDRAQLEGRLLQESPSAIAAGGLDGLGAGARYREVIGTGSSRAVRRVATAIGAAIGARPDR